MLITICMNNMKTDVRYEYIDEECVLIDRFTMKSSSDAAYRDSAFSL